MLPLVLRCLAIGCMLPGLWHLLLGTGGDWLVGINVPTAIDPSADSQNRFYGAIFIGFGAAIWWASEQLRERSALVRLMLIAMLLGAVGRGFAYAAHGPPSTAVLLLWVSELVLPPLLLLWFAAYLRASA